MEQHSSQDPWGWLSIFSYGSRAFHASGGEPKCTQRWHNKKLTKWQGKAKKSGEIGRQHHKTTACPNSAGLLSVCVSSCPCFLVSWLRAAKALGQREIKARSRHASQSGCISPWWLSFGLGIFYWYIVIFYKYFFFFVICSFELTDFLLKARWKWPLGEWGAGGQLGEGMYAGGGNCADTRRKVHRGQWSPLLKAFQKIWLPLLWEMFACTFLSRFLLLFILHLLPLFVLRGHKSLLWPFLQISAL